MAALPPPYARPRKSTARYAVEYPTHGKALQTPRMVAMRVRMLKDMRAQSLLVDHAFMPLHFL